MTTIRVKQQVACDGIKNVWHTEHGVSRATMSTPSIDGSMVREESGRSVHVRHARPVVTRRVQHHQIPVLDLGAERTLRNLIRNTYTIRLRHFCAV